MKVKKRDGRIEEFKEEKIARVVKAAGLEDDKAKRVASKITSWAKAKNENPIASVSIRDQIIVELQKINRRAADFFIWYEKNKDKNQK